MSDIVNPYQVLVPGMAPPPVMAFCQLCDLPALNQCMDIVKSGADWIGVHVQCCGQTRSSKIQWKEFLRMRATGEKWYAITKKGLTAGLRGMARRQGHVGSHG